MRSCRVPTARVQLGWTIAFVAVLGGCASAPGPSKRALPSDVRIGSAEVDGPGRDPPPDLASRPDAEPRVETIRSGGPNKPYQVLGRSYVPETRDAPFGERGLASWYGAKFHGRRTASGEVYDMYAMTAAHPTLPIPSYARIRNPANGREVLVRVNDRGPFVAGRIVDLSYAAAAKLDVLRGVAPVEIERITFDEIRTGAWRARGSPRDAVDPGPQLVAGASAAPAATTVSAQDVDFVATAGAAIGAAPAAPATVVPGPAVTAPEPAPAIAVDARPPPGRSPPQAARGFWVQLGAFRQRDGAESLRRSIGADTDAGWLEPLLAIFTDASLYRVQAGPYRSRDEAESAASRARAALAIVPVVVERR